MRLVIVAVVGLAACGPAKPPAPKDPAPAGACPATWAAVTADDNGDFCDIDHDASCDYPEGSCTCGWPASCHEGEMDFEIYERRTTPATWQCDWSASATRPDGCPGELPTGACPEPDQQCTYGFPCCNEDVTCRDGTWQRDEGGCES